MRHRIYGRKFSRPAAHRNSLFKNLVRDLVVGGRVTTTKQKAKAVVGIVDRLVNKAKENRVSGSREAIKVLGDKKLVNRLVSEVAPVFEGRSGGVTRLVPLGVRSSDAAEMVRLEWVVEMPVKTKSLQEVPGKKAGTKRARPKVEKRGKEK